MNTYRCEYPCGSTFEHPESEECSMVDGGCELLMNAGWRPVWVKVSLESASGEQNRHIFSRGGWICPACVQRFAAQTKRHRRRRAA
jgi:hypothetical protein